MIVSHRYKFIFIKTEKTAGTSVEIALSKYLGESDVITPVSSADEEVRTVLGGHAPCNYAIPFRNYKLIDWLCLFRSRERFRFFSHTSAELIKRHVGKHVWESYFKFCFERNPWDTVVSFYYWRHPTEPRPTISEFIRGGEVNELRGSALYTLNGQIAVDRVCRFERLDQEMEDLASILALPETPALPRTKSTYRNRRMSYREVLGERERQKIEQLYAREIAWFNYEW
jgi:hypothetical protein